MMAGPPQNEKIVVADLSIFTHFSLQSRIRSFLLKYHAILPFLSLILQLLTKVCFIKPMVTCQWEMINRECDWRGGFFHFVGDNLRVKNLESTHH